MEVRGMREESEMTKDWSELEALRESLREHIAEIHRLRAALAEGAMQRLTDVQQEMERKPLTDEELDRVWRSVDYKISYDNFRLAIARAIERAHGIGGEE
jgi:hypothetical protein